MIWITGLMTGKMKTGRNETMANTKAEGRSADYKAGYSAGYNAGLKADKTPRPKGYTNKTANWVMRKGDWYCSNCNTKHEQAHDDFCCKCGYKMDEEADYEDN